MARRRRAMLTLASSLAGEQQRARERRNLGKVIKPHKSKCGSDASSLSAFASASASASAPSSLLAQLFAPCIVVVAVAEFVLLLFPLTLHFQHI